MTKPIVAGLSGPSSSGKTTLARLLRGAFNQQVDGLSVRLFILHEDDFYKTDADIPVRTITSPDGTSRELQDWDCVESLDLPLLESTLRHIKSHGELPPDMISKEDQNSIGETQVSSSELENFSSAIRTWLKSIARDLRQSTTGTTDSTTSVKEEQQINVNLNICILDGFLLFPPPPHLVSELDLGSTISKTTSVDQLEQLYDILHDTLDVKLFLTSTFELTVYRRARRTGYVTLEGFWEDPPGYVEDIVWPNYARDHGWMFQSNEDVDAGKVSLQRVKEVGIDVGPGSGEAGMKEVLEWGVNKIKDVIRLSLKG